MNWEESWTEFKGATPRITKYGELVGSYLDHLEETYQNEPVAERATVAYEVLLEHFGGDVPVHIQEEFAKDLNYSKDFILENLQTHNWKGMWAQIQDAFRGYDDLGKMEPDKEDEKPYLSWMLPNIPGGLSSELIKKPEENSFLVKSGTSIRHFDKESEAYKTLKNICDFWGYTPSGAYQRIFRTKITFDPVYPENASEYVHEECKGWGYTITPKENASFIEKVGLRCRNGNRQELEKLKQFAKEKGWDTDDIKPYREFPKRIYFAAFNPEDDIEQRMKEIAEEVGRNWESVACFKINFNKMHCPIYRDPAMTSSHAFFTYTNIPASFLQRVH